MPRLDLRICAAKNLYNAETFGKIDPYCTVSLEGKQWRTDVVDNTCNPEWNAVFKFHVADPDSSRIHLVIWDDNVVSDTFLGEYYLSISGLDRGQVEDKWVLLQNSKTNAELHIRVMAVDFGDVEPEPETPPHPQYRPMPQSYQPPAEAAQYYRPPQQPPQGYPPQQPPQGYPPQQGGYPPQGYPPQQPPQGYPPQQPGYPPQQQGYAPPPQQLGDRLGVDQQIPRGQTLQSLSGRAKLVHQEDGNVVLYRDGQPVWSTETNGRESTHVILQRDGNLVLYNGSEGLWGSGTNGQPADSLVMQDDGNLVLYAQGNPVWASNTGA